MLKKKVRFDTVEEVVAAEAGYEADSTYVSSNPFDEMLHKVATEEKLKKDEEDAELDAEAQNEEYDS